MKNRMKYITIIGSIIVILAIILFGMIILIRSNSPERRLQAQLELGSRYLEELDYDRAIVAFEAAIDALEATSTMTRADDK